MSLLIQSAGYIGDYQPNDIIHFKFTVTDATGAPASLSGTPAISVYKDSGTTESTSGITLTVDFDAKTGLCQVDINTSSDGSFYARNSDFQVVITTGTVGAISVVGTIIANFGIDKVRAHLADKVDHCGSPGSSTASLSLKTIRLANDTSTAAFYVTNSGGTATKIQSTGNSGKGFWVVGDGIGLRVDGTNSSSVYLNNSNSAHGVVINTDGGGDALFLAATVGAALELFSQDAPGLYIHSNIGLTTGQPGVLVLGIGTSPAVQLGDGTNGTEALKILAGIGNTDADGVQIIGAGVGHDINLAGDHILHGNLDGLTASAIANLFTVNSTKSLSDAVAGSLIKTIMDGILNTALTESYSANGSEYTLSQALYQIVQNLQEKIIEGVLVKIKKLDHTTDAYQLTLDDATNPTSYSRSS